MVSDLSGGPDQLTPADLLPPPDLKPLPPVTVELFGGFGSAADNNSADPIETFYQTKKCQWMILAADLTAAGVPAQARLDALELQATALPGRQLDNFRIGLSNTTTAIDDTTPFPRPFYGTATQVYGPVDEPVSRWVVGSWTTFALPTAFSWDGTSNLLVETSYTLAADGVTNGGLLVRNTARTNALIRLYAHGATPAYPFSGLDAFNGGDAVPAIRVTYRLP